ncbi:MAG: hypothetical protein IH850_02585 [Acidobacteria bacterium]|nr:hypothetical protein [Acidobacteriota bacterium]
MLFVFLACLSIRADDSVLTVPEADDPTIAMVADRVVATVEDGYRVFLVLARDQGRLDDNLDVERMAFEELREHLVALCLISARWNYDPGQCLRRDVVAYMSASYLGIRPGLLTGLFGMTRRYAHREMQFRQYIAPGSPRSFVTGSELLSVATRISICVEPHQNVTLDDDEIH